MNARDEPSVAGPTLDPDMKETISSACDVVIAKAEPFVRAHKSALGLLAELTQDGSLPANSEYHKAISSALEAVGTYIHLNVTLKTLKLMKQHFHVLPIDDWTENDLQDAIHQAQVTMAGLGHTTKIERALRVQNRLSEASMLDNSNFRLNILGSSLAAMWAWTHEDQNDPDAPGVDFGLTPFVHVALDFIGKPQYYDAEQGWIGPVEEAPLANMPGSRWGLFYRDEDLPFFHEEVLDSVGFTVTHYAAVMEQSIARLYLSSERMLDQASRVVLTAAEQTKRMQDLEEAAGHPFPIGDPATSIVRTRDYSEEWTGSLTGLKNTAMQDEACAFKPEFLSHVLEHILNPNMPLGHFETIQTHLELTFPTLHANLQ